jgi:hypothetical protein
LLVSSFFPHSPFYFTTMLFPPPCTSRFFGSGGIAQKEGWVERLIFAAKIEQTIVAI